MNRHNFISNTNPIKDSREQILKELLVSLESYYNTWQKTTNPASVKKDLMKKFEKFRSISESLGRGDSRQEAMATFEKAISSYRGLELLIENLKLHVKSPDEQA